ncbi:MAG: DUF3073 domain-containing protein [Actinomycetes bacterium]|jgi:hypothetical protein
MGRGRAKAKQTKVARQLKYSSTGTDLDALQAELSGSATGTPVSQDSEAESTEYDQYGQYGDEDSDSEDDETDPATAQ